MELERKEIFRALVGSHNYNLNTETSDYDYKVFIAPTFDDLYANERYSKSIIGEDMDLDIHDVRKVSNLWWKANVNFIEVLFSKEVYYGLTIKDETVELLDKIFAMRNDIAKMNLPYLYNACVGMYFTKMKNIHKLTNGVNCYSEDTLFLTDKGWKLYDDITKHDLLATINKDNGELKYQPFKDRFKKPYKGKMYEMDNTFSNCLTTGNHNMLASPIVNRNKNTVKYKDELANWVLLSMEDLINSKRSSFHIRTSIKNTNEDYNISDDMLKIIGAYVSEGTLNFRDGKVKSVRITQTENGKKEFIDMMNSVTDFNFVKYIYEKEIVWISHDKILCNFLLNNCKHISQNKQLPNFTGQLSKRQCNILLESLYLGDGTKKKIGDKEYGIVYYTISKQLALDVHALGVLCEKDTLIWGGDNGYKSVNKYNGKDLYTYQVYIKNEESFPKYTLFKPIKNDKGIKEINYDGNIVCFSVENQILVTQRRGKIGIHGNSNIGDNAKKVFKECSHVIRILDFLQRFADSNFEDFEYAINYENGDSFRNFLFEVKNGGYTIEKFIEIASDMYATIESEYRDKYLGVEPCEETNQKLIEIVKQIVKNEL